MLGKMAYRMRSLLGFMQKEVRVWAESELDTEQKWKSFLENDSFKISEGKFNAIILLTNPSST